MPTLLFDFCGSVGNGAERVDEGDTGVDESVAVMLEVAPEDSLVLEVALIDSAGLIETTCPLSIQTPSPFLQQVSAVWELGSPQQKLPSLHMVIGTCASSGFTSLSLGGGDNAAIEH